MVELLLNDFEQALVQSENQTGLAVLMVFAWIAVCDDDFDQSEAKYLAEIAAASNKSADMKLIVRLAQLRDMDAIQLSCELIARQFTGEQAERFLEMAIGMVVADGRMMPTENYVLRFLADLLQVGKRQLNEIFLACTGRALPGISDVGSADYWAEQESAKRSSANDRASTARSATGKLAECYAVLGLAAGATKEEIQKAYRRLAQVHHPDRFASLGEESVAAATVTFRRINEAYEYLVKHA
jgi:DnaJ-domain-containing protein 1